MQKKKYLFVSLLSAISNFSFVLFVNAKKTFNDANTALSTVSGKTGITEASVTNISGNVVTTVFIVAGLIFFVLMVYAGVRWMTARDKSESVEKARNTMIAAVIGLVILLASYAVTTFLQTNVIGLELTPASIKRMVRKNTTRLDDCFKIKTKDNEIVSLLRQIRDAKDREATAPAAEKGVYRQQADKLEELLKAVRLSKKQKIDFAGLKIKAKKGILTQDEKKEWGEYEANEKAAKNIDAKKQALDAIINFTRQTGQDWGEDQRKEARKSVDGRMEHIRKLEEKEAIAAPPATFYAQIDRRSLEAEEMKKITTDNYHELISYFRAAQHDKDPIKMGAIFRKLANDYNDNEIVNSYGYTSNFEGFKNFCEKELVQKGNMSRQHMMALAQDVAQTNEERKHWETARTVGFEGGRFRWFSPEEHMTEALAEIRKQNPRDIARSFNRLAYGGEFMKPDGTRGFKISPLGIGILMSIPGEIAQFIQRAETNPNIVVNLHEEADILKQIPEVLGAKWRDPQSQRMLNLLQWIQKRVGEMKDAGPIPSAVANSFGIYREFQKK